MFVIQVYGIYLIISSLINVWLRNAHGIALNINEGYFIENLVESHKLFGVIVLLKFLSGIIILINRTTALGVLLACIYLIIIFTYMVLHPLNGFSISVILDFVTCVYLLYAYSDFFRPLLSSNMKL